MKNWPLLLAWLPINHHQPQARPTHGSYRCPSFLAYSYPSYVHPQLPLLHTAHCPCPSFLTSITPY